MTVGRCVVAIDGFAATVLVAVAWNNGRVALSDRHFLVKKAVDKKGKAERTRSTVAVLIGAEIEGELAAMAGDGGDAATLEQARSLVRKGKEKRRRGAAGEAG